MGAHAIVEFIFYLYMRKASQRKHISHNWCCAMDQPFWRHPVRRIQRIILPTMTTTRKKWKLKVMVCVCFTRPFRPVRLCRTRRACKVDPFDLSNASSILPFEKRRRRSAATRWKCDVNVERANSGHVPRTHLFSVSLVHSSAHFSHSFRYWVFLFPDAWLLSRSSIWPHRLNAAAHVSVLASCVWTAT